MEEDGGQCRGPGLPRGRGPRAPALGRPALDAPGAAGARRARAARSRGAASRRRIREAGRRPRFSVSEPVSLVWGCRGPRGPSLCAARPGPRAAVGTSAPAARPPCRACAARCRRGPSRVRAATPCGKSGAAGAARRMRGCSGRRSRRVSLLSAFSRSWMRPAAPGSRRGPCGPGAPRSRVRPAAGPGRPPPPRIPQPRGCCCRRVLCNHF